MIQPITPFTGVIHLQLLITYTPNFKVKLLKTLEAILNHRSGFYTNYLASA